VATGKTGGSVVGYVILIVVVLVLVIVGAFITRRRGTARGVNYAPEVVSPRQVAITPILTPEASTQEIVNREFVADTADDLLDPHNPRHAQWVSEHSDVETDEEYLSAHPEDAPKSTES
jgi:hypothetical protein